MAQHDYAISDQSGLSFLSDINNLLAAIASQNSGATEPSPAYTYMPWADTTTGIFKIRNAANNGWISLFRLDGTFSFLPPEDGEVTLAKLADGVLAASAAGRAKMADGFVNTPKLASGIAPIVSSINGGPLAGFRNLLINGNPTINQRGYVSGTATISANQYTLDRWRVVVSGQSTSWTDSANVRTVTAPAGGVEQVIEGANIFSGTYTLNWTGTATATVGGTSVAQGGTVTLTGGTNATVRFSNGTFSLAQLEPGPVATPFERRPIEAESGLCQRYGVPLGAGIVGLEEGLTKLSFGLRFPHPMRTVPTLSLLSTSFPYRYIAAGGVGDRTISITIHGATTITSAGAWLYIDDPSGGSVAGRGAIERNGTNFIFASAEL